jgi:hypothetical protein
MFWVKDHARSDASQAWFHWSPRDLDRPSRSSRSDLNSVVQMPKHALSISSIIVLAIATVAGGVCYFSHYSTAYSEPQATVVAAMKAASAGDLSALTQASTSGYYEDLIGQFGQSKYERVRAAYQEAYDRALPKWAEYRQRVDNVAANEFRKLRERIDTLGREAVGHLSLDERMRLTEDRGKYAEFVFDQGLKALAPEDRKKIEDPEAFRSGSEMQRFAAREGWNLLSPEDRAALGSQAALDPGLTPEKTAFLAKTGVPLLGATEKQTIAGISPEELSAPRTFMLKYGADVARRFFAEAAIHPDAQVKSCTFMEEEQHGSLLRGDTAICSLTLSVRSESYVIGALLRKTGFAWKLDRLTPDLFQLRAAYPPRRLRPSAEPTQAAGQAPFQREFERTPQIQYASWQARPLPEAAELPLQLILGKVRGALVSPLLWVGLAVLFIAVMTINFRRLKSDTFVPEWLEGECELDEVAIPTWFLRTITRLTSRRILQVRLNWFFTRRRVLAVALDDVNSITWRRHTNWLLILLGLVFIGQLNPAALLLVMVGVEAKILSIRFNTPFAQMPFIRVTLTSFQRKHFSELARFFRRAQLYWAQVRTQKQIPVPVTTAYQDEVDRDFLWGRSVWLGVGVWMLCAILQRVFSPHISLDGLIAAPLLLGVIAGLAQRSLRNAVLAAVMGLSALLTMKFPGSALGLGPDGAAPLFEQYAWILVALASIAVASGLLARVVPAAAFCTPVLWLGFVALFRPALAPDVALWGKCALAVSAAVLWSWVDATIQPGTATVPAGKARAASVSE